MIAVLMTAIAGLAIVLSLWPLWSRGAASGVRRRALNVASYRSRLAEIEVEASAGAVDAASAQALRDEAAARLLADATGEAGGEAELPQRRSWGVLAGASLLIALVSGLGYYWGDSRQLSAWIAESERDPQAGERLAIDSMIQRLEQRLAREGDDADGWAMLGRSYFVQQRFADAAGAYERANRLSSAAPSADWLADEGEVRILLQDRSLAGLPRQLFERAVAIDPHQPKALWYGGLAAAEAGEYGVALDRWLALRATELPDEFRAVLESRLQELAGWAGRELPAAVTAGTRIVLEVSVDPALSDALDAGDTLFVLARRPGGSGGPPLAVRRLRAAELPAQVVLDDSHAMAPGMNLSTADSWEVLARVSRSGTAQAQSGDLEGRAVVNRAGAAQPVRLQIDRRLP